MRIRCAAILASAGLATGCITTAVGNLPPITPQIAAIRPSLEQTVGDFEFTLEGGKMITSNKAGRLLNDEILKRWKARGYVSSYVYVESSGFTGKADYNLTLSGSQYGESSIGMQILSGLTLFLLPYTVDTKYDLQYVVENVKTGEKFSAAVEDSYHTTVELLLFVAAPIAARGQSKTMDAIADHLYDQLRRKGAFEEATPQTAPGASLLSR
jgi:hypothetical protein